VERKRGRPKTRWKDDIVVVASGSFTDITKDRQKWPSQRERDGCMRMVMMNQYAVIGWITSLRYGIIETKQFHR